MSCAMTRRSGRPRGRFTGWLRVSSELSRNRDVRLLTSFDRSFSRSCPCRAFARTLALSRSPSRRPQPVATLFTPRKRHIQRRETVCASRHAAIAPQTRGSPARPYRAAIPRRGRCCDRAQLLGRLQLPPLPDCAARAELRRRAGFLASAILARSPSFPSTVHLDDVSYAFVALVDDQPSFFATRVSVGSRPRARTGGPSAGEDRPRRTRKRLGDDRESDGARVACGPSAR